LLVENELIVSVLVARSIKLWKETVGWQIDPVWHERKYVTLLARMNTENQAFLDFYVLPHIDRPGRFQIRITDSWLERGVRVEKLSAFHDRVRHVAQSRKIR
jgi:hypothetical protein